MILIHWLRALAALPFLWLGKIALMLKQPVAGRLLAISWHIGGVGQTGRLAIQALNDPNDPFLAMSTAQTWMQRCPRAEVGAIGGVLAMQCGEMDIAAEFLRDSRAAGDDPKGMADLLEMQLAAHTPDAGSYRALVRSLSERRDLSPNVSRLVIAELMMADLLAGRFEDAERRARHLEQIEETVEAAHVLWAVGEHRGDERLARHYAARAAASADSERARWLCSGLVAHVALGRREEADALHAALREADPALAAQLDGLLASPGEAQG